MTSACRLIATCLLLPAAAAQAQRADDNVLQQADDAFGTKSGVEQVGIYDEGNVRGFNPLAAGNLRIEGLYFDQQGALTGRTAESSTVRIGANVLRYPFPAPTGIVDYHLRRLRDDASLSGSLESGPFGTRLVGLETGLRLPAQSLTIPVSMRAGLREELPGVSHRAWAIGVVPEWRPRKNLTVRFFVDLLREYQLLQKPLVYLRADATRPPPLEEIRFSGQHWAQSDTHFSTLGALVDARLTPSLDLTAGLFHSDNTAVKQYTEQLVDTDASGNGTDQVAAYPEQHQSSFSGEIRLAWHHSAGRHSERLIAVVRGRNVQANYGGEDFRDLGVTPIDAVAPVARPQFVFHERTRDRSSLYAFGVAIESTWHERVTGALGLQRLQYRKRVEEPGNAPALGADQPWRAYGNLTLRLAPSLMIYAGFTQGLEDSGLAPPTANNRGSVLPAVRTSQRDAGLRWRLNPKLQLVAGVFDVQKPYFNLANDGNFEILGEQRRRGFEASLSGDLASRLHVVAGVSASRPTVTSNPLSATPIGTLAVGRSNHVLQVSLEYGLRHVPGLSVDGTFGHWGEYAGSLDNRVMLPASTNLDLGARYKLPLRSGAATLRLQLLNVADKHVWDVDDSGGYLPFPGRAFSLYLVVER